MKRRRYLITVSAATTGIAGCTSSNSDSDSSPDLDSDDSDPDSDSGSSTDSDDSTADSDSDDFDPIRKDSASPIEVVEKMYDSIDRGEANDVLEYTHPDNPFWEEYDEEEYAEEIAEYGPPDVAINNVEIVSESDEEVVVRGVLVISNMWGTNTYVFDHVLRPHDGEWLLYNEYEV